MKTAWITLWRQRADRSRASISIATPPTGSAGMRKKLSYATLVLVPAVAAIAMAPIAAADPADPVCGYGQRPERDACTAIPPLNESQPDANDPFGMMQTTVKCPPGSVEVSEGICGLPFTPPSSPSPQTGFNPGGR